MATSLCAHLVVTIAPLYDSGGLKIGEPGSISTDVSSSFDAESLFRILKQQSPTFILITRPLLHNSPGNFEGEAPWECYDWVSQKIIRQHLESGSMWAIIPLQDYMDMWDELRSPNPYNDQINHPGTSVSSIQVDNAVLSPCLSAEFFQSFMHRRGTGYTA